MRRVYRKRRDVLIAALARWLPAARPSGIAAGLHVMVSLPPRVDEAALTERAASAGIRVYPLKPYRVAKTASVTPAILLGYASLTPPLIEQGVQELAMIIAELARA
jgi:GntR family transcriptional regulator/MocR family aminotransferase